MRGLGLKQSFVMGRSSRSEAGWRERTFFVKVLINPRLRFDSPVFSFYILTVKGVASKSEASESERCFLEGDNNVAE